MPSTAAFLFFPPLIPHKLYRVGFAVFKMRIFSLCLFPDFSFRVLPPELLAYFFVVCVALAAWGISGRPPLKPLPSKGVSGRPVDFGGGGHSIEV